MARRISPRWSTHPDRVRQRQIEQERKLERRKLQEQWAAERAVWLSKRNQFLQSPPASAGQEQAADMLAAANTAPAKTAIHTGAVSESIHKSFESDLDELLNEVK